MLVAKGLYRIKPWVTCSVVDVQCNFTNNTYKFWLNAGLLITAIADTIWDATIFLFTH